MAKCSIHGAELIHREGVSKTTGKPYSFEACPEKNADGTYCKAKPMPEAQTSLPVNSEIKAPAKEVDWDRRNFRIERQHSQEMALRYLAIFPEKVDSMTKEEAEAFIKKLTDWFHKDLDSSLMGQTTDLSD